MLDEIYALYAHGTDYRSPTSASHVFYRALALGPRRAARALPRAAPARRSRGRLLLSFDHLTAARPSTASSKPRGPSTFRTPNSRRPHYSVDLPPSSYDLVTAFFSIIHLPRLAVGASLSRIAGGLVPGGVLRGHFGVAAGDHAMTYAARRCSSRR